MHSHHMQPRHLASALSSPGYVAVLAYSTTVNNSGSGFDHCFYIGGEETSFHRPRSFHRCARSALASNVVTSFLPHHRAVTATPRCLQSTPLQYIVAHSRCTALAALFAAAPAPHKAAAPAATACRYRLPLPPLLLRGPPQISRSAISTNFQANPPPPRPVQPGAAQRSRGGAVGRATPCGPHLPHLPHPVALLPGNRLRCRPGRRRRRCCSDGSEASL